MADVLSQRGELIAALREDLDRICTQFVAYARAEIPSLSRIPDQELRHDTTAAVSSLLGRWSGEGAPDAVSEAERLDAIGRRRAFQGVPLDDVLRSWRLGIDHMTGVARVLAEERGIDPTALIDLFQRALSDTDGATSRIAAAYRAQSGPNGLLDLLRGELNPAERQLRASALGLDPEADYIAFATAGGVDALERGAALIAELPNAAVTADVGLLVGACGPEPPRGLGELVCVGPMVDLAGLPESLGVARRLLAVGTSLGLAGLHDLASLGPSLAIAESPEVAEALSSRYLAPLGSGAAPSEMILTIETWLDCDCRVEACAERLHVHQNTVRYRLARFAEETGADLDSVEERFSIWWALRGRRLS